MYLEGRLGLIELLLFKWQTTTRWQALFDDWPALCSNQLSKIMKPSQSLADCAGRRFQLMVNFGELSLELCHTRITAVRVRSPARIYADIESYPKMASLGIRPFR